MGILKCWICQERFSYFSRIRDIAAKCRDFEAKEVRKSAEKDSLAGSLAFELFKRISDVAQPVYHTLDLNDPSEETDEPEEE